MEFLDGLPMLTQFFLGFILLLTIYFTVFQWNSATVSNVPALLTSIGIFGTFLGIAIGLMAFDVSDIKGSVPYLIDGLKTSFWSSIAGLYGALIIKAKHIYQLNRQSVPPGEYAGATVDDLAGLLTDIKHALVSGEDDSLMTQNRALTSAVCMRLDRVLEALDAGLPGVSAGESAQALSGEIAAEQLNVVREMHSLIAATVQQQAQLQGLLMQLDGKLGSVVSPAESRQG